MIEKIVEEIHWENTESNQRTIVSIVSFIYRRHIGVVDTVGMLCRAEKAG